MHDQNQLHHLLHNSDGSPQTRLDAALWSGQFGFWEWDLVAERVVWLNDWCATLNLDPCPEDGHEYHWNELRHPADRAHVEQRWLSHQAGETEWFEAEYRIRARNGEWRWIGERGKIIRRGSDSAPLLMIGACFDIHQRRVTEAGLKQQQQLLEKVSEQVPAWLLILDLDGRIEFVNRPIDGHSPSAAIGHNVADVLKSANRRHLAQAIRAVRATLLPRNQTLITGRMPASRHFECRIAPVIVDGELTQLAAIAVEVTDRRQLERAVIEIANREQHRLSLDLHDGLGQELFGISLLLRGLLAERADMSDYLRQQLQELATLAGNALETTRSLARGLAPIHDGYSGLVQALRDLRTRFAAKSTILLKFELAATITQEFEQGISDALYRIAQEAIINAVRHSNATFIRVSIVEDLHDLVLEVEDDGVGIGGGCLKGSGLGTRIMLYRAEAVGANITFESRSAGGVVVRCRYPLRSER